jgi:hypothetical protein
MPIIKIESKDVWKPNLLQRTGGFIWGIKYKIGLIPPEEIEID